MKDYVLFCLGLFFFIGIAIAAPTEKAMLVNSSAGEVGTLTNPIQARFSGDQTVNGTLTVSGSGSSSFSSIGVGTTSPIGEVEVDGIIYGENLNISETATIITLFPQMIQVDTSAAASYDYRDDINCMGAWAMEETGANNEVDLSGNSADLAVSAADNIDQSADRILGSYSRDFESGDSENLYMADAGSTDISGANQSLSLCAWIKLESDTGAGQGIFAHSDATGGQRGFALHVDSATTDAILFTISSDGSATNVATGATALDVATWYHVCGVYNDVDMRVYINGALDSNGASNPSAYTNGIYNSTSIFAIGSLTTGGAIDSKFDGLIDDAIVFNRALSAAEVKEIYQYGTDAHAAGTRTFFASDTKPNVEGWSYWNTGAVTVTITDFLGGVAGQVLVITSKGAITFDCTASGLVCGTTDIVTAAGDESTWVYDGTDWNLLSRVDQSDDLN